MSETNSAFLVSLLIIVAGYVIKKTKVITETDGKIISKLVLYITFPALILHTVSAIKITGAFLLLPLFPLAFSLILLSVFSLFMKNKPEALKGVIYMALCGFNIGLFAYPIVEGIWGKRGLQYLAIFDVGNAIVILCISYTLGFVYSPSREQRKRITVITVLKLLVTSVPLLSYSLALLMNISGFAFPAVIEKFIEAISRANMALVLILLGIYLNLHVKKQVLNTLIPVMVARYALGLALGLALYYLLPFEPLYKTIALVGLILPVGLTIIPFADEFGYNQDLPVSFASITIVISFVLLWGLITILNLA